MQKLAGRVVQEHLLGGIRQRVGELAQKGLPPGLAVIRVGDDPASEVYVRSKIKLARGVGMHAEEFALPASTSQTELAGVIDGINADPRFHGCLCQLPLPAHLSEEQAVERIAPKKDIDFLHPLNFGWLAQGVPRLSPCTPAGIMALLAHYQVPLAGKRAVVLGRSNIVGRPMSLMLGAKGADATVTSCHSRSKDLPALCREAEILVVAVGKPEWVTAAMVAPGAVVVDVGIHRLPTPEKPKGYRLCGDVDAASVAQVAGYLSPVPGGVGVLTVTMVLENTLKAYGLQV